MHLKKYSPIGKDLFDLKHSFRGLGSLIENFMEEREGFLKSDFTPSISTREGENAYHLDVDLPGVKKEDIRVDIKDNFMTISGERRTRKEEQDERHILSESSYGRFERGFELPENADVENIRAESKEGVLEVVIPKMETASLETKKVEVQ